MNIKALAAVACLWAPMVAVAADGDITSKVDSLNQKLEKILSSQGISVGGQAVGEYGSSVFSGNAKNDARRDDEVIGFTQVDFDLRARPNTITQARAVFRLFLNDASFWGAPYTPFETRWLSLDGATPQGIFYYHLGSQQQKWSPLTIWSPDPIFLYTPRIFAQEQKQTMAERFLGDNVRNFTGFNTGIRAAVPSAHIDSFNVGLLAAKLLTGAPLGSAASQFISNYNNSGDGSQGYPDTLANFDRWALGGRGTVTFLGAFNLGANYLFVEDLKSTYGTTDTAVTNQNSINRDSLAQKGYVASVQLGADVAKFIQNKNLILALDAEVGTSSWDNCVGRDTATTGTSTGAYIGPVYETSTGTAINASLKAGWKTGDFSVSASGGYLSIDSSYRSDLAQTPIFNSSLGRIYNTEQDIYNSGKYSNLLHYNTFDALYHSVHHWVAEEKNEYSKTAYDKLAYSNYVAGGKNFALGEWTAATATAAKAYAVSGTAADKLTLYKIVLDYAPVDRDIQMVLPGGEATPNRVGPKLAFDADFLGGGVEAHAQAYLLQEANGTVMDTSTDTLSKKKADFQQIQAGVRFRLDRFAPHWNTLLNPKTPIPLELSVSYGLSTAKGGTSLDYQSTQYAASAYIGVLPRLALIGGFQQIQGVDNTAAAVNRNMTDIAGGVEFKVQEGAYFQATYSLLKTEYPNASEYDFDQSVWTTKLSISF